MVKAKEGFEIVLDKAGNRVPYKEGYPKTDLKFIKVKKGEEIPSKFLKDIANHNIHLLADVKFKDMRPINLPKELGLDPSKPKVKKEYTKESLTEIYEEKGFSALRAIGDKFGVKGRSLKGLIADILKAQEQRKET